MKVQCRFNENMERRHTLGVMDVLDDIDFLFAKSVHFPRELLTFR
jgi:hypothetical protein